LRKEKNKEKISKKRKKTLVQGIQECSKVRVSCPKVIRPPAVGLYGEKEIVEQILSVQYMSENNENENTEMAYG